MERSIEALWGSWTLTEVGGSSLTHGETSRLVFEPDGSCLNDRGPNRQHRGQYEFDVLGAEIAIREGDTVMARLQVRELTAEALVAQVGPDLCRFARGVDTDPSGREGVSELEPPKIQQLSIALHNVRGDVYLNSVLLSEAADGFSQILTLPVNALLVGAENELRVTVLEVEGVPACQFSVNCVSAGESVEIFPEQTLDLGGAELPTDIVFPFASEEAPFRKVLDEARQLGPGEVIEFAAALAQSARSGEKKFIEEKLELLMEHAATAFRVAPSRMRAELEGWVDFALSSPPDSAVKWEPRSMCGDKVWELRRATGEPFLFEGSEEGSSELRVFVADVGSGLQILR